MEGKIMKPTCRVYQKHQEKMHLLKDLVGDL